MYIGVMLPNFENSPAPALEFAVQAELLGLHGVFSYDHLWPMAHPGLPSLSPLPLLAAASALTDRIRLGTLVARIGLEPDDVVAAAFCTLSLLSNNRVIAAMGTGDHKSDDENVAFGLNLQSARVRRAQLESTATRLVESGIETWIGGGSFATNDRDPARLRGEYLGGRQRRGGSTHERAESHLGRTAPSVSKRGRRTTHRDRRGRCGVGGAQLARSPRRPGRGGARSGNRTSRSGEVGVAAGILISADGVR